MRPDILSDGDEESTHFDGQRVPQLLHAATRERRTGTLVLTRGDVCKRVVFSHGSVMTAASNDRDDRLIRFVITSGLVSLDALHRALEHSLRKRQRLGEVLVEQGALSRATTQRLLRQQFRHIVRDVLEWPEGSYAFESGDVAETDVALNRSGDALVVEVMRTHSYWARIIESLGGPDSVFAAGVILDVDGGAESLSLTDPERRLLERTREPVTLRGLCEYSELSDYEVCRTVWTLLALDALCRA
jgi:hypothetical protein